MSLCSYTYKTFVIGIVIIFCINIVKTENYDDRPDYHGSASIDSESNEVYNVSLKEKPLRITKTETKDKFVADSQSRTKSVRGKTQHIPSNVLTFSLVLFCPSLKYDVSAQSKSVRIIHETLKKRIKYRISGNITIDISCNDNSSTVKKSEKCKQTLANYPYSVSIQKKGSHYASGALIHKKWILTVAREFYNVRETIKLFRARLGSVNCKKGGTLVPLKGIEIHPSYVYDEPSFDLAMLRVGHIISCSEFIKPISLSNVEGLIVSAKFLATYWPRLIVNGKVLEHSAKERIKQNSMRVSTQKMISWDQCYNLMDSYNFTLEPSSLCLEPIVSHHSPCMPDVGAPIIAEDGLWGITSGWASNDCSTYPSPTIFTRTSLEPMKSWLETLLYENI